MTHRWTDWLHRYPMILVLIPIVIFILWSDYAGWTLGHKNTTLSQTEQDSTLVYRAALIDYPLQRNKTVRFTANLHTGKTVYLYFAKDSTSSLPTAGDTVIVYTRLQQGGKIGSFDYGRYLLRQGIAGSGYVAPNNWIICGHKDIRGPKAWQQFLIQRYRQSGINEQQLPVLSALTLGYKEDIDANTRRSFQRSGAAHILAVSGLHTGLIASLLAGIITLWGRLKPLYEQKWKRRRNSLFIIIGIWIYAALTGMTPSVVRSAVMVTMAAIAYMFYRKPIGINTLLTSAVLILIVHPTDLFSISFQLSFAAVFAILLCHSFMESLNIITISLAAQLGVMPLTLYYFGQTSNYFMLTNLVVLPMATIVVYLAVAILALGPFLYVGPALAWLENHLLECMQTFTSWIENLPYAVTERSISIYTTIELYGIIIVGIILLNIIHNHRHQINNR